MPKSLKVDIISDLHLDMYTFLLGNGSVRLFVDRYFPRNGDLLILAGDITHKNSELPELFRLLTEKYKQILVVPGNHDFYLIDEFLSPDEEYSEDRYQNLLKACSDTDGKVVLLNCDYYEYKGFTFFGMVGWYDGQYGIKHFELNAHSVNRYYKEVMNDSRKIRFRDDDNSDMFNRSARERNKMSNIKLRKADVFISHAIPSIDKRAVNPLYRDEVSTAFYTFDGSDYLDKISPEVVVHGHTHRPSVTNIDGIKYIVNPFGYPYEYTGVDRPYRITLKKGE